MVSTVALREVLVRVAVLVEVVGARRGQWGGQLEEGAPMVDFAIGEVASSWAVLEVGHQGSGGCEGVRW